MVATPNGVSSSCDGGTMTTIAGTDSIGVSGGILPAGTSCTFTLDVTGTTLGTKINTTSAVTSNEADPGNAATDTITVVAAASPTPTPTPTTTAGPMPITGSQSQTHATIALTMIGLGAALLTISHRLARRRRKTT